MTWNIFVLCIWTYRSFVQFFFSFESPISIFPFSTTANNSNIKIMFKGIGNTREPDIYRDLPSIQDREIKPARN